MNDSAMNQYPAQSEPASPDLSDLQGAAEASTGSGQVLHARGWRAAYIGELLDLAFREISESLSARRLTRLIGVLTFDALAVTVTLALVIWISNLHFFQDFHDYILFLLSFSAIVTCCLFISGVYRRSWRFLSYSHGVHLVFSVFAGSLAACLAALTVPAVRDMGTALIPLAMNYFAIVVVVLIGVRVVRRSLWEVAHRRPAKARAVAGTPGRIRRALVVGPPQWARSAIEMSQSENGSMVEVVGVLLPKGDATMQRLRKVPVFGSVDKLDRAVAKLVRKGTPADCVIACDDGMNLSHREMSWVIHRSRQFGLEVFRVEDPWRQLLQRTPGLNAEQLPVEVLLGRNEIDLDRSSITRQVSGQCILVTGAGGTIGSELCRQLATFKPSRLVLLDHSEFNLYSIEMHLREQFPDLDIQAEICSVCQKDLLRSVFQRHRPVIVYHAAALKHVPIVEMNPCSGVQTNIVGTKILADAVCEFSARAMIQVSTDKAVNPVGMMGATKRAGELYSQALDMCGVDDADAPRFMTVRFGNVLGSSGSIVPLFERQLRQGMPLTVTHPDIERFFMTVREAVQLVLQSSANSIENDTPRGTIFVLDMGAPVRILDLARRMIKLYGLEPDVDVPIKFVGLRPGEKLYEELFDSCEEQQESRISGIFEARSSPIPLPLITRAISLLERASLNGDSDEVRRLTHYIIKLPGCVTNENVVLAL